MRSQRPPLGTQSLVRQQELVSFDGTSRVRSSLQRPDRRRMLELSLDSEPRIARGSGLSYVPASFGAGAIVQDMRSFDHILSVEPDAASCEVEAGFAVGDLIPIAGRHGLWLPVQPGHPAITIGGCIAANVHGKNGTAAGAFVRRVKDLTLFHPDHGTVTIDRTTDPVLFDLTCGGFGLTGVIVSATLILERLPGGRVVDRRVAVGSLAEAVRVLRDAVSRSPFAVSWHDPTTQAGVFGRGFVYEASFDPEARDAPTGQAYPRITAESRARLPISLWSRPIIRIGNELLWRLLRSKPGTESVPLFEFLFPFAFRPIYFRLFGRPGFIEAQVLVPLSAIDGFLTELRTRALARSAPLTLLTLKLLSGTQRLLRFEGDGVCVTVDVPATTAGLAFLGELDAITVAASGIPNLIKDSRLSPEVAKACYPEFEAFRDALRGYDPRRLFRSALSERLGL